MADSNAGQDSQSSGGNILLRKTGPLANWIWMAIILLVALVYAMWKRNKAAAAANTDTTGDANTGDQLDNQTPPPVFILPQNPQPTVPVNVVVNNPGAPPPNPPSSPGTGGSGGKTNPPPSSKPPAKPGVSYEAVHVAKFTSKNAPWNSTLWGIAKQYGYGSAGNNYLAILNDPKNAALKAKIKGNPKNLPVGAVVYVRKR